MPPAAKQPTAAGAEAFVRYWLSLYSYTYNTNDQIPWASVADDGCRFCKSVIDNSTKQVEAGMHTVGGSLRPQYVLAAPDWSTDDTVVSADYVEEPASGVDARGKVRWRTEGKPYAGMMVRLRFDVVRGWVVVAVDVEDADQ